MAQFQTHYDNLKVARNAPPEVIRAAYKSLSQKFHPDRNPDDPEAAHVIVALNTSFAVLSDPEKRQQHDRWIAQQELLTAQRSAPEAAPPSAGVVGCGLAHLRRHWLLYGLAAAGVWAAGKAGTPPPGPKPYQATPLFAPAYVRPDSAPNGQPWPAAAGYVAGYPRLSMDGYSTVTVDNSRHDSDVFVKLVALDEPKAYPVREVYVPAFGRFTLSKVSAGRYDIRYRDLDSGALSRTEAFTLEQKPARNGVEYSYVTLTLYDVRDGNAQIYALPEAEF